MNTVKPVPVTPEFENALKAILPEGSEFLLFYTVPDDTRIDGYKSAVLYDVTPEKCRYMVFEAVINDMGIAYGFSSAVAEAMLEFTKDAIKFQNIKE